MTYTKYYQSPLGKIILTADDDGLTGLYFEGQKYFPKNLVVDSDTSVIFDSTQQWLDIYFSGKEPDIIPSLNMNGSKFQIDVWKMLLKIPYGKTKTYGEIAEMLGMSRRSAQAVGNAVAHNAISLIIPCHRVVGANGSLTGYAGGVDRKLKLLELEKVDTTKFFIPKRSTAP